MAIILGRKAGGGGGGAPSGPAGGDLAGTYPNPTIAPGALPLRELFRSVLGGAAASIDSGAGGFATDGNDLLIVILARTTEAIVQSSVIVRVNNDSSAIYDRQTVRGANASATAAVGLAATGWTLIFPGANALANQPGTGRIYIPNYGLTTFNKVGDCLNGYTEDTAADNRIDADALGYRSTTAISRVSITAGSGNLVAGSTLAIYAVM